ncbi:hypothetical protein AURDEDRAFT_91433 [Auricularia subglabra TFB-10046 SS5]|uniref:F-box domain-containing protein n=1 Tax=Auricularia subglabra (strain TFB-10046 / SS5) TaxID=717982 RepID=J0LIY0_AURST|nr:hypothetical protein AURDEDRAFT_91433 [Auricularia subglabra TFB-10046 SS5]
MPPRKTRNPAISKASAPDAPGSKRRVASSSRANALKPAKLGARQGGLQFVTKFPLDVLYEIFRLLHPRDLLALSRTDKSLRAVLLDRAAGGVWREAIAGTGIPERPDDISLPRYASLAFDAHCEMCDRNKAGIYHWSLRARLCRQCSKARLVTVPVTDIAFEGGALGVDYLFKDTVPTSEHFDYLSQTLAATFLTARDAWRSIAPAEVEAYLEDRKKHHESVMEHARRCSKWQLELSVDRSNAKTHLREDRMKSIVERLRNLGFDEELDFGMDMVAKHSAVAQPRALTDRIWKMIEPALLELMEDVRRDMARCERKREVRSFLRGECLLREDVKAVLPDVGDLDDFPAVDALLDIAIDSASDEYARLRQAALESFPAALAKWRRKLGVVLYDHMHKNAPAPRPFPSVKTEDEKIAVLNRATTVFSCLFGSSNSDSACADERYTVKAFAYPYVLAHACTVGRPYNETRLVYTRWMPFGLRYHRVLSQVIATLVRLCGLDPKTATRADMDLCDARFTCKLCLLDYVDGTDTPVAETWWTAAVHWHNCHPDEDEDGQWLRLGPVAEALVRGLAPPLTDEEHRAWRCMRCSKSNPRKAVIFSDWFDATTHASNKHGARHRDNVRGRDFVAQDGYASVPEPDTVELCDVLGRFADRLGADGTLDFFVRTPNSDAYFLKLLRIAARQGLISGHARAALQILAFL